MNNLLHQYGDDPKRDYMQHVLLHKIREYRQKNFGLDPKRVSIKFLYLKKVKSASIVIIFFESNLRLIIPTNSHKCKIDRVNNILHCTPDFSFLLK